MGTTKIEKSVNPRTGKLIGRNQGIKKNPVMINRDGSPHIKLVRRQTNDQLLREFFNARGFVRLRLQPTIQSVNGGYYGWHGGAVTVEIPGVEEANVFAERLRKAILDLATELKLTVRANAVIS
jgi:hypothetical protein